MNMVFRIRNFADEFENAESRKLRRLTWLALPTKQEGDGYTELMGAHPNGCAHFGAWTAMIQLAAKCSPRGTLVRDLGGRLVAHDLASISRITRVPVEVLREAMPRLLEMGWMEEAALQDVVGDPPESTGASGGDGKKPGVTGEERRGEDQTGQHRGGEEIPPTPPASPDSSVATPASPEAKKIKRRADLLVILKAHNCKLEFNGENIFEEWIDETDGRPLPWIDHLLNSVRPRIRLPSKLRQAIKDNADQYRTWLEKNK